MSTFKKINNILNVNQKRNFYLLLIVTSFVAFLDFVGIGAILPILIILTDSEFINNEYIQYLVKHFSFLNEKNFLNNALLFLLFIFIFKTISSLLLNIVKYKILFDFYQKISSRLMSNYLNLSYSEFLKLKIFEKTNIVKTEVEYFVLGVIEPFLVIFLETSTIFFIFLFLIYFDPEISIKTIIIIVIPSIVMSIYFGKRITKLGYLRHDYNNQLQLQILQGLQGIKEIKLSSKENILFDKFSKLTSMMGRVMSSIYSWQVAPRHFLELLIIFAFLFIIFISISSGKEFSDLVITLGIFAAAAFRIMPSLARSLVSINSIRQTKKVIDVIYKDLNLEKKINKAVTNAESINLEDIDLIEIKNLSFKFDGNDDYLINDLNLIVQKGEYLGIYGKSGSGKSTFVDLFSGLLPLNSGKIIFNKKNINEHKLLWRKSISYVPQEIFLNNETIKENVAFGEKTGEIDENKVIKSLKNSQLYEYVNSLPDGINTIIAENGKNLSGGQIQRIGIARALYRDSKILIFDESTNSLDFDTEEEFMTTINKIKGDRIILFISHKKSILKNCDAVYELNNKSFTKRDLI